MNIIRDKIHDKELSEQRLIPPDAHEEFIAVDSGLVRFLRSGKDNPQTPIILIHGGGTDNAGISWYKLFKPLSEKNNVLALDLPGFGATKNIEPVGGPSSMADFVVKVMRNLSIEEAHICGVSMGGDVALNIAIRHPSFVKSLILIAPGGLVPVVKNRLTHIFAWLGAQLPDWILFPLAKVANKFVKSVLRGMVSDPLTLPIEVVDEFYREAQKPYASVGYARYNQATIGFRHMKNNLLDKVSKIEVPVLFFHGENDALVDKEGSKIAVRRMPHADLILVENCGHWVQIEAHDIFLNETKSFLEKIIR